MSIEFISESDSESMNLFYLLGMLPGGIAPDDLDKLWEQVEDRFKESTEAMLQTTERRQILAGESMRSGHLVEGQSCKWRRAFLEL